MKGNINVNPPGGWNLKPQHCYTTTFLLLLCLNIESPLIFFIEEDGIMVLPSSSKSYHNYYHNRKTSITSATEAFITHIGVKALKATITQLLCSAYTHGWHYDLTEGQFFWDALYWVLGLSSMLLVLTTNPILGTKSFPFWAIKLMMTLEKELFRTPLGRLTQIV